MPKEILFSLTRKDFTIEDLTSGGKGGQHANRSHTAIRITHPDSGAVGYSADERSQFTNKKRAFERMAESDKFKTWHKMECARYIGTPSKGNSDGAIDKEVRLYNFKRSTAKDAKTGIVLPLKEVLDGKLSPFHSARIRTVKNIT